MAELWTAEIRKKLATWADILAVAIAVSLPWSTSATAILVGVWFFTLVPVLRWDELRRDILTPAGGLPVLLVLLGLAGMLWADVTLLERWKGLDSFLKLLAIPLLFAQFRQSHRGDWVFAGYLFSCVALLATSFVVLAIPALAERFMRIDHVIVKNAATQSGEFVTCIFGLLYLVAGASKPGAWPSLPGAVLMIFAMLVSIVYVATGRTALVVFIVLFVLFAARMFRPAVFAMAMAGTVLVGALAWVSSPYLRARTTSIGWDLQQYASDMTVTSSGERLVFWTKSIDFIQQAPLVGHGTGSIHGLFEKSAVGKTGAAGEASTNPHNQTFAVGIQLGFAGIFLLWAMWIAHLLMFRGSGLAEWIGLIVVVQNIVGSLFNSHLFDFTQGWTYVVGVGVAGGMVINRGSLTTTKPERNSVPT
jgi:O-antigen ligase